MARIKPKPLADPGLGERHYQNRGRMINKDGSFNSIRKGLDTNTYHYLISISKLKISAYITVFFILINLFFACIYYWLGADKLGGISYPDPFIKGFLFSMQTFTTVGFGAIYPSDTVTGLISGIEAMTGLLFFAFATGITYGRFSKPSASVRFSDTAIIAPYRETMNAFMFRIVNAQANTLIEMTANVMVALAEDSDDRLRRKYFSLELQTSSVIFFPMPWTIVHPITPESPLNGMNEEDLKRSDAEFLIHIKGYDETYAQTTNTIYSYKYNEIQWGRKFKLNYTLNEQGTVEFDINKIGETEPAALN